MFTFNRSLIIVKADDELFPMSIVLVLPPDDSVLITKKAAFFKIFVFLIICVLLCWLEGVIQFKSFNYTYVHARKKVQWNLVNSWIHSHSHERTEESVSFLCDTTNWKKLIEMIEQTTLFGLFSFKNNTWLQNNL